MRSIYSSPTGFAAGVAFRPMRHARRFAAYYYHDAKLFQQSWLLQRQAYSAVTSSTCFDGYFSAGCVVSKQVFAGARVERRFSLRYSFICDITKRGKTPVLKMMTMIFLIDF